MLIATSPMVQCFNWYITYFKDAFTTPVTTWHTLFKVKLWAGRKSLDSAKSVIQVGPSDVDQTAERLFY